MSGMPVVLGSLPLERAVKRKLKATPAPNSWNMNLKPETVHHFLQRMDQLETFRINIAEISDKYKTTLIKRHIQPKDLTQFILKRPIKYRRLTSKYGYSRYHRTRVYTQSFIVITNLSISEEQFLDTFYHECAHQISSFLFDGTVQPHGKEWKYIAATLGALPRPTAYDPLFRKSRKKLLIPVARCPQCKYVWSRIRLNPSFWKERFCLSCNVSLEYVTKRGSVTGKLHWNTD